MRRRKRLLMPIRQWRRMRDPVRLPSWERGVDAGWWPWGPDANPVWPNLTPRRRKIGTSARRELGGWVLTDFGRLTFIRSIQKPVFIPWTSTAAKAARRAVG